MLSALCRRMHVHCHGGQCDAQLQAVTQLPGVSAALDGLMSSASVAGAPLTSTAWRFGLTANQCNVQWANRRLACS